MSNTIPNRQVICQVLLDRAKKDKTITVLCSDSWGSASLRPLPRSSRSSLWRWASPSRALSPRRRAWPGAACGPLPRPGQLPLHPQHGAGEGGRGLLPHQCKAHRHLRGHQLRGLGHDPPQRPGHRGPGLHPRPAGVPAQRPVSHPGPAGSPGGGRQPGLHPGGKKRRGGRVQFGAGKLPDGQGPHRAGGHRRDPYRLRGAGAPGPGRGPSARVSRRGCTARRFFKPCAGAVSCPAWRRRCAGKRERAGSRRWKRCSPGLGQNKSSRRSILCKWNVGTYWKSR